jgi:hypothetical protein
MGKLLTDAQIASFASNGFVSPVPVLDADERRELERHIESFEARYSREVPWAFDIKCNLLHDWVVAAGTRPRLLDAVEDLIGPDILLTDAVFRIKEPGSATEYGWHQDSARIQVEPCFIIVYLAVTPATRENGCLQAIPGSHGEVLPFSVVENSAGQADRRVARVVSPDVAKAVPLELAPGEAAFFSANVIHGSAPNLSRSRRIAILYDYTSASARQSAGRGSGQLVRGTDRWGHFGHEPFPEPGFTRANAQMRRRILRTYPENPLMGPLERGASPRFPDAASGPYAASA